MKPFLKWAGGKYKLLSNIQPHLSSGTRLVEPFVGAGAMFLNTAYDRYWINDINPDLVNLYRCLKDGGQEFIQYAKTLFARHDEETYYERRRKFNRKLGDRFDNAELFLWLNRHGFNGLCRYNSSGEFNVPFGKYKTIYFPEDEMMSAIEVLRNTKITCLPFQEVISSTKAGDVLYCDPPYIPASQTASFTNYSGGGFGVEEQRELADLCFGRNAVVSNSLTPLSLEIFGKATIHQISVRRNISCKAREMAGEIIAVYGG